MSEDPPPIRINRAPVLTLWASIVAERLGFDRDLALTLGQAIAGMSAYAKGVSLGLIEPRPETVRERGGRLEEGERLHIDLLGRAVPVVRTPQGLRALAKGKPGSPERIERYLQSKFKDRLAEARAAMAELVAAFDEEELGRCGFKLYEAFRPEVPKGERGWGAVGVLDPEAIRNLKSRSAAPQ